MQAAGASGVSTGRIVRRYCPISDVFDDNHVQEVGECQHKHHRYFWEATDESNFTIIGDSLVKNIRHLKFTDVQAFPGVNAYRLFKKTLVDNIVFVDCYRVVILAVGTNDVENLSVDQFYRDIEDLVKGIFLCKPTVRLGVAGILPRLKDFSAINDKVIAFNKAISAVCKKRSKEGKRIWFLPSYRAFLTKEERLPITEYYKSKQEGGDGIHLSKEGEQALKQNLVGHVARLQGYN